MNGLLAHLDVGRALLALLISVVLFAVVRGEENPTNIDSFDVPVEILDEPPGLVIVESPSNPTARIAVSAPRELWPGLRMDSFRAVTSLSGGSVGTGQYRVNVDHPDPRISVLSASPSEISVRLDQEIATTVPVRLDRSGNVPVGYEAGEPELDPTNVAVTGPAAIVNEIAGVAVAVRLDGVTVDVDGRYAPSPINAEGKTVSTEGRGVRLTPPAVRVRIPVAQQLGYKTVGVQPNVVGAVQSGFVIEGVSTEPSAVTIVGAPRALGEVNFALTEEINVTDVNTTLTRQVTVVVPDGVSVVQQETARVTVRISPLVLDQIFSAVPIPEAVTPGLQVVSALPNVQIILRGPVTALRGSSDQVRVTASLAGLSAGTHSVNIEVSAPPALSVQSVNPRVFMVTLSG